MISIIVPIYNVEQYLPYCLESIAQQTYKDFEAILVDDGSTDSSGAICDGFQQKDPRFKPIHQQNSGVSVARNAGLAIASGEHIAFVDGDDYVHPSFLETLLDAIKKTGCDVSMIKGEIVYEYRGTEEKTICEPQIIDQDNIVRNTFLGADTGLQYLVVWNKLYSRNIIRDIEFKNIVCEDGEFNLRTYLRLPKMAFVETALYYYVQRSNSLIHQTYQKKSYIDELHYFTLCSQHIPEDNLKYRAFFLEKLIKRILSIQYEARGSEFEEYADSEINKSKRTFIKEFKSNPFIPKKKKIGLLTFLNLPILYATFRWFCERKAQAESKSK